MKKLVIAIFVILYFLIVLTAFNLNVSFVGKNGFSKNSKYIWINEEDSSNSWVCFRKKINIDKNSNQTYKASIAVDSKYWLYINGKIVIREGGVKRSRKNSIFYDEIDLKDFLVDGENTIAILVWHFGKNSFSHIDSTLGSLLFYMDLGNKELVSDSSWKCIKNKAYLKDEKEVPPRLSESNIYYDANLEIENWYEKDFDDSSWENGIVMGKVNDKPWGKLIKRNIPLFSWDEEITEYENISEYKNLSLIKDQMLEMKLPKNVQFTPYLKIESKKGKVVRISSNNKDVENAHEVTYITKDGVQEFEALAWTNGDKIYYYIPEGVKIVSLGYRKTEYKSEVTGTFKCNDDFLNSLYEMSIDTLKLNMRDSFMDCPDRERTMWIADTTIAMEEANYSLDKNALDLYIKGIEDYISWKDGKVLMSVIPSYIANLHLPIQNLMGIDGIYNYYMYTGDKKFLEKVYPVLKDYLNIWKINSKRLAIPRKDYYKNLWKWYDTAGITDDELIENAWVYYANKRMYEIAKVLDEDFDELIFKKRLEKLAYGINNNFYVEGEGYKSKQFEGYDGRANSILVLAELVDESKYDEISKILLRQDGNTPIWEKYILEALCQMDKTTLAEGRIKETYSEMVSLKDEYSSTLWEYFEKDKGSKNHTWSGSPMIIMQKYIAGIKPLEAGFDMIKIKPNLESDLNEINSKVQTVAGNIELEIRKNENEANIIVDIPKTTVLVLPIKGENHNVIVDGKSQLCFVKGNFLEIWIYEGTHNIKYIY